MRVVSLTMIQTHTHTRTQAEHLYKHSTIYTKYTWMQKKVNIYASCRESMFNSKTSIETVYGKDRSSEWKW